MRNWVLPSGNSITRNYWDRPRSKINWIAWFYEEETGRFLRFSKAKQKRGGAPAKFSMAAKNAQNKS